MHGVPKTKMVPIAHVEKMMGNDPDTNEPLDWGFVGRVTSVDTEPINAYLKSEIVPPVCPKCPDSKTCPALARQKPCPSCPPCGRCPEPAFECKKVPNYSAISASNASNLLPMPRLNSFAQFN